MLKEIKHFIKKSESLRWIADSYRKHIAIKDIDKKIKKYETFEILPGVVFETSSFCNLACVKCPHSSMKRKKGFISLKLVKKIMEDIKNSKIRAKRKIQVGFTGGGTFNES